MEKNVLNRPTLVLNKQWFPITIWSAKKAFVKTAKGVADIISVDDIPKRTDNLPEETLAALKAINMYTWDQWVENSFYNSETIPKENCVQCTNDFRIRWPEVVVLKDYDGIPDTPVKLTRRNLLIRDKFHCQYTGQKVTMASATIDHIVPQSKGGKTVWTNVVIAALEVNMKKADRTPEQSGLTLLSKPRRPKWNPMFARFITEMPESWQQFINTNQWNEVGYWDVELKEE